MGSGVSSGFGDTPGGDLRLPASGLRFTANQLRTLNTYVDTLYEEDQKGRISTETEATVEALIQRIVDGAGQRDHRFKCCHLVALHRGKKMRSRSLEYLVTLDSLPVLNSSEECILQSGPVGYGTIRLRGKEAEKWEEFLTPAGYLCRDKVVERWVELIARCASARGSGASRALSARSAHCALPYQYCYLERVSSTQTCNDSRLAIVEGAAWVMVRVGAGEAEAKLMLGARVQGCDPAAYTTRVPITHPMALLHYTAAQNGYYAVTIGPPTSIVCNERSSTWQLWNPSLEATFDAQYSDVSNVARVAGALNALVDKMREGNYQGSIGLLSRYAASCVLRRRLDKCATYAQTAAKSFVFAHASCHLLLVLDSLLSICENGGVVGYVYGVGRGSVVRRGARDTSWVADAVCLKSCLDQLHIMQVQNISHIPSEALEAAMFSRWESLNREARAAGTHVTYSRRQLRYLWSVTKELITCKNLVVSESHSNFRANLIQATSIYSEPIEDLIHILAIMLDQARDMYINTFHGRNISGFDRELSSYRSKKWNKLKEYYDASSSCLIDAARRDPELLKIDMKDEILLMKTIINWLHKGAKDDKKYFGPVLKPYLNDLFNASLENSWFLEDFYQKRCEKEFEGLKEFCMRVHDGTIEPCMGLLDAAKKFIWSKALVDFIDRFRHIEFRLVFPTGDGMAISFPIKLPSRIEHNSARVLTLSRKDKAEAKLRLARRCVLGAFTAALVGHNSFISKNMARHNSTDEILVSAKSGKYMRTTKPDVIPYISIQDLSTDIPKIRRRSRKNRPATAFGFPEISVTQQSDAKTIRKKYHTLRSLVYTEPVENIKELKKRPRSAGSTMKDKSALSRPSLLETLDFINSVKDALCVEESGVSDVEETVWSMEDEWLMCQSVPLNLLATRCGGTLHHTLGDIVPAMLNRGKFTVLQELCGWLDEGQEGALFALHRLARAARSRSSERSTDTWKLPETDEAATEGLQKYRPRLPDYTSGDEAPQPPPLPRRSSRNKITRRYTDYIPPDRLHALDRQLSQLELNSSRLNLAQSPPKSGVYTGVINPIYDIKMPRNKFSVKRSKSLSGTFNSKRMGLEITKYNITLGHKGGQRTNDVVTAITGMSGETGLETKSNFFQRYSNTNVTGDAYRLSRVTID